MEESRWSGLRHAVRMAPRPAFSRGFRAPALPVLSGRLRLRLPALHDLPPASVVIVQQPPAYVVAPERTVETATPVMEIHEYGSSPAERRDTRRGRVRSRAQRRLGSRCRRGDGSRRPSALRGTGRPAHARRFKCDRSRRQQTPESGTQPAAATCPRLRAEHAASARRRSQLGVQRVRLRGRKSLQRPIHESGLRHRHGEP